MPTPLVRTLPEYKIVLCPDLAEGGGDPRTFTRDGFCNCCGQTGHPEWDQSDARPT